MQRHCKKTVDFLILDDVKTVMNSEASTIDRVISEASILPVGKPLKLIKAGGTIKFTNKTKMPAKEG
ncbi:hypothetical protein [Virgibacillus proomii]|uniref:hypothetical protein n=1 Tax=Virgibacillus proomii TaxID=84407 RepID=UPI001C103AA6|nr:hypothetical protein [Virgibacillus proomii]MBU5267102.1 hypothetical protein [Virgibacillus proomii]